jgi:hypothetical protein
VLRKVAARENGVTVSMISYLVKMGYVKRHYVLGNEYNYLVDLNEVTEQLGLGVERKSICYNKNVKTQPKGKDGKWIKV